MNEYNKNLGVRERAITTIPLPFEAIQQSLAASQSRYDQAEELEIQSKAKISSLSSPIEGYNNYLEEVKNKFLTDAMNLHKSMPDKGSSEYKRKLNELLAGVQSDRNLVLINEGNQAYAKYAEDRSNLLKNGKYYGWRDTYKNFKGVDENGKISRFNYIGLQEGVDTDKLVKQAVDMTGKSTIEREHITPDGKKVKVKVGGKSWKAIKANIMSTLGQPGMMDLMEKNGLKNEKELNQFLDITSQASAEIEDSRSETYDFSLQKELRDRASFDVEFGNNEQLVHLGDLPIPDMANLNGKLNNFVDKDGVVKSEIPSMLVLGGSTTMVPTNNYDLNKVGPMNFYSQKNASEKNKELLIKDPTFGPIIDNYRKQGLSVDAAIKQASTFIRNHGNKQPLKAVPLNFDNKANANEVKTATQFIEGGAGTVTFLSQKTGKPIEINTEDGVKANVFGRIGPTSYGNKGYLANVNGIPVIATYTDVVDSDATLDKQVYDVKYKGAPQKVENWQGHPDVKSDKDLIGGSVELLLDLQGNVIAKPLNKRLY